MFIETQLFVMRKPFGKIGIGFQNPQVPIWSAYHNYTQYLLTTDIINGNSKDKFGSESLKHPPHKLSMPSLIYF